MFILKKLLASLLLPLPFCSVILVAGLILLWFTTKQRLGKIFVSVGAILLILCGYGTVSNLLLGPLERQYAPLLTQSDATLKVSENPVKWIVVLGAGDSYTSSLPSSSQLLQASLARIIEGVRLHREFPGAKLIFSEGTTFDALPAAEAMSRAAQELGVEKRDIVLEAQSKDTEESARLVQAIVGNDRFILVTSAWHMRRSMALFRKLGMSPIPAPTDRRSSGSQGLRPSEFYPSAAGLRQAELALHEYLGLAWARLRGKI